MADLDPQPIPPEDVPEVAIPPVIEEIPLIIPPNRPRKVYDGMWGPVEIGAVAAGVLAVAMGLVLYFFWVVPSNRELARNKSEAERLDAELALSKSKYGEITDSQTQVDKLVTSVDDFETRYLAMQELLADLKRLQRQLERQEELPGQVARGSAGGTAAIAA